jgi:hypothetical protein
MLFGACARDWECHLRRLMSQFNERHSCSILVMFASDPGIGDQQAKDGLTNDM